MLNKPYKLDKCQNFQLLGLLIVDKSSHCIPYILELILVSHFNFIIYVFLMHPFLYLRTFFAIHKYYIMYDKKVESECFRTQSRLTFNSKWQCKFNFDKPEIWTLWKTLLLLKVIHCFPLVILVNFHDIIPIEFGELSFHLLLIICNQEQDN